MFTDAAKANLYRKRAEELRAQAEASDSDQTQEGLLGVAKSYDSIAAALDRIAASKRKLGLPS